MKVVLVAVLACLLFCLKAHCDTTYSFKKWQAKGDLQKQINDHAYRGGYIAPPEDVKTQLKTGTYVSPIEEIWFVTWDQSPSLYVNFRYPQNDDYSQYLVEGAQVTNDWTTQTLTFQTKGGNRKYRFAFDSDTTFIHKQYNPVY